MIRLDHLAVEVSDIKVVRDWYTSVLGLEVEFDTGTAVGLKDDSDFTLILAHSEGLPSRCSLYFQVDDVASMHSEMLARGVVFTTRPRPTTGATVPDSPTRTVASSACGIRNRCRSTPSREALARLA
jgi:catechol 2,3-dioxygenase-like lactoylglutathione lyase family enzyme